MSLLAVSTQLYGDAELITTLKAGAFWPRPDVDWAVLRLTLYPDPLLPFAEEEQFFALVKAGFSQKRKQLKNDLQQLGYNQAEVTAVLQAAGVDSHSGRNAHHSRMAGHSPTTHVMTELSDKLTNFIQQMPKAEIHIHLEGAIQPKTVLELAKRHKLATLPSKTEAGLRRWFTFTDFPHFVKIYLIIQDLIRTADDFALIVYENGADMAAQNIRYREITVTPYTHTDLQDKGLDFAELFRGLENGRLQAKEAFGVEMRAGCLIFPATSPTTRTAATTQPPLKKPWPTPWKAKPTAASSVWGWAAMKLATPRTICPRL